MHRFPPTPKDDNISQGQETAPAGFDTGFYGAFYPDLRGLSDEDLRQHYIRNGIFEARWPNSTEALADLSKELGELPSDFSENTYYNLYPEIREFYSFQGGASIHYLTFGRQEGRSYQREPTKRYDRHLLNLLTNRIHDLPDVRVDEEAPVRINVLVPAFDFRSMSAGFFGVFQVARFISQCGFNVRLVMFDNFYWNEAEFRVKLMEFPGMERLFDELEIDYIGSRDRPLAISPSDNCVATVWYSAYFANKIMECIGGRPFLYLIQDYESSFFPGGSLFSMADESYCFSYNALFSSKPLMLNFLTRSIGMFSVREPKYTYFNNACASYLPPKDEFIPTKSTRKLAFYSRPTVNRNMFELGALTLIESYRKGLFAEGHWEFYGVGIGDISIDLDEKSALQQMPRMTLKEYQVAISKFDLGLCLMASPHPSLLPFDLAGSGAVVVTNTFGVKTREYFAGLCDNIIARRPTLEQLVTGMGQAIHMVEDREARYLSAQRMTYPREWKETFSAQHSSFILEVFDGSLPRSRN